MKTLNLTIKEIVDGYSKDLKSHNLSEKEYKKYMDKFKIDMIDAYMKGDFYIIDYELLNGVAEKLKNFKHGTMLINKKDWRTYISDIKNGYRAELDYKEIVKK